MQADKQEAPQALTGQKVVTDFRGLPFKATGAAGKWYRKTIDGIDALTVRRVLGEGRYGSTEVAQSPNKGRYTVKTTRIMEGLDRYNSYADIEDACNKLLNRYFSTYKRQFTMQEAKAKTAQLKADNFGSKIFQDTTWIGERVSIYRHVPGKSLKEFLTEVGKIQAIQPAPAMAQPAATAPLSAGQQTLGTLTLAAGDGYMVQETEEEQASGNLAASQGFSDGLGELISGMDKLGVDSAGYSLYTLSGNRIDKSGAEVAEPTMVQGSSSSSISGDALSQPGTRFANIMPLDQQLSLAKAIIEAVQVIHAKNIIHLDLHPGNLIVDPKIAKVTVIDFGLAAILSPGQQAVVLNSRGNMYYAPVTRKEAARKREDYAHSKADDIFAVGMIFKYFLNKLPPVLVEGLANESRAGQWTLEQAIGFINAQIALLSAPMASPAPQSDSSSEEATVRSLDEGALPTFAAIDYDAEDDELTLLALERAQARAQDRKAKSRSARYGESPSGRLNPFGSGRVRGGARRSLGNLFGSEALTAPDNSFEVDSSEEDGFADLSSPKAFIPLCEAAAAADGVGLANPSSAKRVKTRPDTPRPARFISRPQ